MCPTSPPAPCAPEKSLPSRIRPAPTPVLHVTYTIVRVPRPAPWWNSPRPARLASFSRYTGQSMCSRSIAAGEELAAKDQAGAAARAPRHVHHCPRASPRPLVELAEARQVGVVLEVHRAVHVLTQHRRQWDVLPAGQVGRVDQHTTHRVG